MNPVAATPGTVNATVTGLQGWSVQEDAAAACIWEFRKASVTGAVVFYLNLAAGESASIVFPKSVSFEGGVYVKEVSGSATGILLSN